MTGVDAHWEKRMSDLWAVIDDYDEPEFLSLVDELVAELPAGSAVGLFERGSAFDSTGHPDKAVALYEAALETGLEAERRRAVIQMSSSLRNLGHAQQAVDLLTAELDGANDEFDGAVRAILALALTDVGREREAVAVAVGALAEYLSRYNRSMARNAQALVDE